MVVQSMMHIDLKKVADTYPFYKALKSLDVPLVITFVALPDNYTKPGIKKYKGETYLTIRLPYEELRQCRQNATGLMKYLLLSKIRHLKHLDWYPLYYQIKNALEGIEEQSGAAV